MVSTQHVSSHRADSSIDDPQEDDVSAGSAEA